VGFALGKKCHFDRFLSK